MDLKVSYELIGLAIAILAHAFASIWWASKITSAVHFMHLEIALIRKELEKRDESMAAIWKRIDELRDMVK